MLHRERGGVRVIPCKVGLGTRRLVACSRLDPRLGFTVKWQHSGRALQSIGLLNPLMRLLHQPTLFAHDLLDALFGSMCRPGPFPERPAAQARGSRIHRGAFRHVICVEQCDGRARAPGQIEQRE